MGGRHLVETVMGAAVLAVAGLFVFFAVETAEIKAVKGYNVTAAFYKMGGLQKGSDVRVSGVKVGTVADVFLDAQTYDAVATLSIPKNVKLPLDTMAAIANEGILGNKYVRLEPGNSKQMLADGDRISKTKDFRSLEDQVGEIIFLAIDGKGESAGP